MNIRLSDDGLQMVSRARMRKGWHKQDPRWYTEAETCLSTLKRFQRRNSIRSDNFIQFCKVIGIDDWQSLVEWSE